MNFKHDINITKRDRVMRAWENSMELVRNYSDYIKEVEDDKNLTEIFEKFSKDEAEHARILKDILHKMEDN